MQIGIREMNPAISLAALCTTPLSGNFTGLVVAKLPYTAASSAFSKVCSWRPPQIGGPEVIELTISYIWDAARLQCFVRLMT